MVSPVIRTSASAASRGQDRPRLCVVGTGALGSALLDRLRQHGFSSVLLVDPDEVEDRNLALSPLLRRAETMSAGRDLLTRNKADLLVLAAQERDGLPWRSAPVQIADVGWLDLQDVDLLCCCTDSILSRVETSWIARALRKPLLDGGVFGQGIAAGRVSTYPPQTASPCILCSLAEDRRAAVLGFAASTSLGCQVPESAPAMTGTLATLQAVADAMLAEVLSWQEVAAGQACASRYVADAEGGWRAERIHLSRSVTCPWHDEPSAVLLELPWDEPFDAALAGSEREILLNWPVCTDSVCTACGARSRPMQRVARVRQASCHVCGQASQQPLRAIHRIRSGDSSSGLSPRQLGMPDRHLYWIPITAPELHEGEGAV